MKRHVAIRSAIKIAEVSRQDIVLGGRLAFPGFVRSIGAVAIIAVLSVACGQSTKFASVAAVTPAGPAPQIAITFAADRFLVDSGPYRKDSLQLTGWEPDESLRDLADQQLPDSAVIALYVNPSEPEWLIAEFGTLDSPAITPMAIPACRSGSGLFVYVPQGSPFPPPPYGHEPAPGANPATPAPVRILRNNVSLTPDGLIGAGWPKLGMDQITLAHDGKEYIFAAFRYLDGTSHATGLPSSALTLESLLRIDVQVDEVSVRSLDGVEPSGAGLVDSVAVLRPVTGQDDVLIVDTCPVETQQSEYLFFTRRQ